MLQFAWKQAKAFVNYKKMVQSGECFITIYSRKTSVTDTIIDQYLSDNRPLKALDAARASGEHQLFISESLLQASERLIELQKAGKVANTEGAACHLLATINADHLGNLIRKTKEFRVYLRELEFNPQKVVNF